MTTGDGRFNGRIGIVIESESRVSNGRRSE